MAVSDYTGLFEKYGRQHNVDPALLAAVATQESGGNPKALSSQGAIGLMQIMPRTAKSLGVDPTDPEQAVDGAARLIAASLDKGLSVDEALGEYHGGPNRKLWGPKNRAYRKAILANYGGGDTLAGGPAGDTISDDDLLKLASGEAPKPKAPQEAAGSPQGGLSDEALLGLASGDKAAPEPATPKTPKKTYGDMDAIPIGETGDYTNEGQTKTYWTLARGHALDPKAPVGSIKNPVFMHGDVNIEGLLPDTVYVDMSGQLKKRLGKDGVKADPLTGALQGISDVTLSVADLIPGLKDSTLRNAQKARQLQYDAETHTEDGKGNPITQGGRLVGQTLTSLPLMLGAEAAAAPVLANSGAVGTFLAGKAGQAALPKAAGLTAKILNTGAKVASRASAGAREGATAALLTSSTSDEPLAEQMKTGAALGGALHVVAPAVIGGVRKFISGKGAQAVEQGSTAATVDAASRALPEPVQMTVGQATSDPAQQMLESAILKGTKGPRAQAIMAATKAEQTQALNANVTGITDRLAGQPGTEYGSAGAKVSNRLNAERDAASAKVTAAYEKARGMGEEAMLPSAQGPREAVLESLKPFIADQIKPVLNEVEAFGSEGAPTVRQYFDLRAKLSSARADGGAVGTAAGAAVRALDGYMDKAVADKALLGNPDAVAAWKAAIKSRAEFGRAFEGDDLIARLTERTARGGDKGVLKVAPEDAANQIWTQSNLGWVGKKDLTRDLVRLRNVLGPDSEEWHAIRAETFRRIATEGIGPPNPAEPGATQFSGQKFLKAWEAAKLKAGPLVDTMFTPEERKLIDDFAQVAQKVTTPVKGGENSSNSGHVVEALAGKLMSRFWATLGGAAGATGGSAFGPGGTAAGGGAGAAAGAGLDALLKDMASVRAAIKASKGVTIAKPQPAPSPLVNKILGTGATTALVDSRP